MALYSGQGGHAKTPTATVPVAEWKLKKEARLAESTTSASGGVTRENVIPDGSGSFMTPWDDTLQPESIGLAPGAKITNLKLLLGGSGLMYSFPAIVESIEIVNDALKDIERLVVNFFAQGGVGAPVGAA